MRQVHLHKSDTLQVVFHDGKNPQIILCKVEAGKYVVELCNANVEVCK